MTTPDFEISCRLRAGSMHVHVRPDARTETETGVRLVRRERRRGLPEQLEPGARYDGVVTVKRLIGFVEIAEGNPAMR